MRIILKIFHILGILTLCACARSAPSAIPVEVKVPIPVSCSYTPVERPEWNIPLLQPHATEAQKLKAVLADLELSRGYIEELEAELTACG